MFLARASPVIRRVGVRAISAESAMGAGVGLGTVMAPVFTIVGGFYVLDTKIETKTNHLDTKLDTLTQVVNNLNLSLTRIEEHLRK